MKEIYTTIMVQNSSGLSKPTGPSRHQALLASVMLTSHSSLSLLQGLFCLLQLTCGRAPVTLRDGHLLLQLLHGTCDTLPQRPKDSLGLVQGGPLWWLPGLGFSTPETTMR